MAAAASLIVRIAGDISSLDRSVKAAVSKIRGLATDLQSIGAGLTLGITAPLAAFAGSALKAGGEIQSLKLALTALEGSAAGAERRFKDLLRVAELPGLGIREVVQSDLALRNYGFTAEKAKQITLEFGNALAAAGRGKEDLAEATRQLGQLSARGKVTADNLRPIIERIPQAAKIIQKEFGTLDTEVLQKAGISSERFINVVLEGLSKTTRVSGGIKNDLENLRQAIDIALASAGDALAPFAKRFIDDFANPLIGKIAELSKQFQALPAETQNAIVVLGGLAVATGPVVYALGAMAGAITNIVTLAGKLQNITAIIATLGGSLRAVPFAGAAATAAYFLDKLNGTKTAQENLTRANQAQQAGLDALSKKYREQQEALGYLVPGTNSVKDAVFAYAYTLKSTAGETGKAGAAVQEFVKGIDDYKTKAIPFGEVSLQNAIIMERFGASMNGAVHRGAKLQEQLERLFGAAAGEGDSIARLEAALNRLSLVGGPLSGIFGSFGEASRKAFQFTEEQITIATKSTKDLVAEIAKLPGETRLVEEAWARVGLEIGRIKVPKDIKDIGDQFARDAEANVKKGAEAFKKGQREQQKEASAAQRHIERYFYKTAEAMADVIFKSQSVGQAFKRLGLEIGKSLATAAIEAQLKKLTKLLLDWASDIGKTGIGKVLGGLFGVDLSKGGLIIKNASGAAGSVGGAAAGAAGSGGSAASSAASAATSGLAGIVTAVASAASAISGVVSNFQLAGVNKSLDLIEHEVRYSQIHLLSILEKANEYWPWMRFSHDRLRQMLEAGVPVFNAAGDQGLRLAGGGTGSAPVFNIDMRNSTFGGSTTEETAREVAVAFGRQLALVAGVR